METYQAELEQYKHFIDSVKYPNLDFVNTDVQANSKFEKLVHQTKSSLPENFHSNVRQYKDQVEQTTLYCVLKKLPKGSLHHTHLDCHLKAEFYIQKTYDLANVFIDEKNKKVEVFPKQQPSSDWKNVQDCRKKSADPQKFDEELKKYFILEEEDRQDKKYWDNLAKKNFQ